MRHFVSASFATLLCQGCLEYEFPPLTEAKPPSSTVPYEPEPLTELFTVAEPTPTDALFVIDNSCSMDLEQASLAANFSVFMEHFTGSSASDLGDAWHVGVVSTDMEKPDQMGMLQAAGGYRFIDASVAQPVAVFSEMANLGTHGSADEKGRAAAYTAIEVFGDTHNAGFYREEANLALIFISDEEDQSGDSPIALAEFISWLENLKSNEFAVTASSIITMHPCYWSSFTPESPGLQYEAVTNAVGGVTRPICLDDWASVLEDVGRAAGGDPTAFALRTLPWEPSIEVYVVQADGMAYLLSRPDQYEYHRPTNEIRITGFDLKPGDQVEITYLAAEDAPVEALDTGR